MWSNGRKEGAGVFKWQDGSVFEGHFVNGKREGHGVFCWVDGSMYDG